SNIYSAGEIRSNLTLPFIIIISVIILIPLALSIRRKFHKIPVMDLDEKSNMKRYFLNEIILILAIDAVYYLSLILPWIVYESGGIIFNHIYIFNNLYTWKMYFGEFASSLTTIFFIATIVNSQLNFISLRVSAILKLLYPTITLGFISVTPFLSGVLDPNSLTSNFGLIFPGIGPILMIICSILLFLIGRRERINKIRIGLRKRNEPWELLKLRFQKLFIKLRFKRT
ncbi:MAG: hypothetical protein ACTSP6_00875, partial [Promethearchaeota archaeon]